MKNRQFGLISGLIALMILFTVAFKCGNKNYAPSESSMPQTSKTTTTATKTSPKTSSRTLTEADVRNAFQRYYDDLAESHSKAYAPAYAEVEYTGGVRILEKDEYDYYAVKAPHIGKIISKNGDEVQQEYDYSKPSTNFYFHWKVDKWTWRHGE